MQASLQTCPRLRLRILVSQRLVRFSAPTRPRPLCFPIGGRQPSRLIGHQPVQLGHGASAFGPDCFKCAARVLRDGKPELTGPRQICL
ncbi:MAG: hypothetical protein ABJA67_08120, partial [Chthonomonadales bacterium]